jgi:hypothetical protein
MCLPDDADNEVGKEDTEDRTATRGCWVSPILIGHSGTVSM